MEIIQTEVFRKWVTRLRVSELRIHFGPGYRLYYLQHGAAIVVLLCGGDKGSQTRDIRTAKQLASQWRHDHG